MILKKTILKKTIKMVYGVVNIGIMLSLLFTYKLYAAPSPITQLKSFLATTQSFTANFKQITLGENNQVTQTSEGRFYLNRPQQFRWSYQTPFTQEIIGNQGKVYFYDADLEQITIKKIDDFLIQPPVLLLIDENTLEKNYNLQLAGISEGLQWIKLSPKNQETDFNYILIGQDDISIKGMELSDNFGQLTRIYFTDVSTNTALKKEIFTFSIPPDVDVFEH